MMSQQGHLCSAPPVGAAAAEGCAGVEAYPSRNHPLFSLGQQHTVAGVLRAASGSEPAAAVT
jgi:hypothetical protein